MIIDARELSNDIVIGLSRPDTADISWEILLGGLGGTISGIRDRKQGPLLVRNDHGVEKFMIFRESFLFRVEDGSIQVLDNQLENIISISDSRIIKSELPILSISSGNR